MSALEQRTSAGELNHIDLHFSRLLSRLGNTDEPRLQLLFADLSHALASQHSCIDLSQYPDGESMAGMLRALPVVGGGDTDTPLVLDDMRLYMQRYYRLECRIAGWLMERNRPVEGIRTKDVKTALAPLAGRESDQQLLAILQSLTRQLTIITGGPGTGKTSTVVKILETLWSAGLDAPESIGLAAPTGKAAMRLNETLRQANLPIAVEVKTLHRLLGMRADGRSYRHDAEHPLPLDLLIVDEVSMIDLAMMHRLLEALPADARLILLGDPNQLPSVETGNILGDICKYPAGYTDGFATLVKDAIGLDLTPSGESHRLADAVCRLQRNYRFSPDRGIGRLAQAIRENRSVVPEADDEVTFGSLTDLDASKLDAIYADYLGRLLEDADVETLMAAFERVRILSPVREGDFGVIAINERIESLLADRGRITRGQRVYHGRPVLITRNDYNLQLFNGDIGLTVRDPGENVFKVVFRDARGGMRTYLASRLPPHETCFAMTVHKSQGSEFDHVVLVLPDQASVAAEQIMTRELVYTAITRARQGVTLYFDDDTLNQCLANRSVRHSGLGERFLADVGTAGRVTQLELFD